MHELLEQFEGMFADDGDVRCYSRKVVKTRSEHPCPGNFEHGLHSFPAGSLAVVERAIVDGRWSSAYTCENCVRDWKSRLTNEDDE